MFTFEPGMMLWAIVSFLLVLVVIAKVVYPPVKKVLDERIQTISFSLEETKRNNEKAYALLKEAEEKISSVQSEAHKIVSQAKEKAYILEKNYEQKALDTYRDLMMEKEEALRNMEQKFYKSVENSIAATIITACQQLIKTDLTEEQKNSIIENRIQELKNIKSI